MKEINLPLQDSFILMYLDIKVSYIRFANLALIKPSSYIFFSSKVFSHSVFSEGAGVDEQEGDLHPAQPGDGRLELRLGV